MSKKSKIIVTGGLGFIGSHTVVELFFEGYEVIIVDDLSNSSIDILKGITNIVKSDIIFDYDIDLLDENHVDICLSGLNLENSEKKFLTNKVDLKNTKKGFFEKFFNLFG